MLQNIKCMIFLYGIFVRIFALDMKKIKVEDNIMVLLKEFDMCDSAILRPNKNTNLVKKLFNEDLYVSILKQINLRLSKIHNDIIINFSDNNHADLQIVINVVESAMLIFPSDMNFNVMFQSLHIRIDQKIYFYKIKTQEVFESYQINNRNVNRKLGELQQTTKSFKWENGVSSDFIKRRSNFYGLVIKGMTEFEGMFMNARLSYLENALFFPNNQTYHINNFIFGVYHDILTIIERQLNFSTILYKRKKEAWGYVYPQPNGSYVATGIVGDVFFKRVDIAVASLNIDLKRAEHVDFLLQITPQIAGLYVQRNATEEVMDLNTFTVPFTQNVWLTLFAISIFVATIKIMLTYFFGSIDLIHCISCLWSSLISNFGGAPTITNIDSNQIYRFTIIVSLYCGTVIWISYRAKLTSELSVIDKHYPFTDLESFSRTNWK